MHSNMIHQMHYVVPKVAKVSPDDRMLSILPVWHIFERVVEYFAIINGGSTYYTKVTELRNDIQKARPTFMASAPRVWEVSTMEFIQRSMILNKLHPLEGFYSMWLTSFQNTTMHRFVF